jgi:hypothetical protein
MNFAYEYFFDSAELEVINRLSTTAYQREFPKVNVCVCILYGVCICTRVYSAVTRHLRMFLSVYDTVYVSDL